MTEPSDAPIIRRLGRVEYEPGVGDAAGPKVSGQLQQVATTAE